PRPAGPTSGSVPRRAPSPSSCTRSTPRASRSRARSSPCSRTASRRTAPCGCPRRWRRMSARTGSSPGRREGLRRFAPAVALVLVAILVGLSFAASAIVARHFREDAISASRLYARTFGGLNDPDPLAATDALFELGKQVRELGVPLVVTAPDGRVISSANLPFEAEGDDPRIRAFAATLDEVTPPSTSPIGTVHVGPVPASRMLRTLALLQGLTIVVMVTVAVVAYRSQSRARRDRLWVAMAREAAHQMGTPLTSLQ